METMLREAKENQREISPSLKEQIVLEHTPLIRYIVNRIAVRLPFPAASRSVSWHRRCRFAGHRALSVTERGRSTGAPTPFRRDA